MFQDRQDAGCQLARALERFRPDRPLVLGLPRGGVIVGAEVARALGGDFDVLLVKKLGAPGNPEYALGAVSEAGVYVATGTVESLADEIAERRTEMAHQQKLYRAVKSRISPAGRTVLIVDDGLATGATMIAAIQATHLAKPKRLIVAVPVAPGDVALPGADEFVCLETHWDFRGVGQFYGDFAQVEDETVIEILKEFA
jgi:predicted phosphoribosyltransferase